MLGSDLQQERLRQDLDLATIAVQTRICRPILQAIEEDRFDTVPGGAYRRHFVRQYARALGMDPEAALAEFRKQFDEPPLPLPVPRKKRRSRGWVADVGWALMTVLCLGGAQQILRNQHSWTKHQPWASADRMAESAAPGPVAPAPPASAAQQSGMAVHVAFTATERVWVSVKCDGNAAYVGVLEASGSKIFDARDAVTALIGNAGGLRISVNGKAVGPLGTRGEVELVELTVNSARRIPRNAADAIPAPQL
jgi:cytoskeletal protein RodZ